MPLGDLFDRRQLIVAHSVLSVLSLLLIALAPSSAWGGWLLVCALGAALNGVALLYWWSTLRSSAQNTTSRITLSV